MDDLKNSRPRPLLDQQIPDGLETATFAMGWFWGPDAQFGLKKGVYRTRVGYCGGTTDNPTYENIGDYIETLQLDFNPKEITYSELLKAFFDNHSPEYNMRVRQYVSAIFYHDEKQKNAALEAMEAVQKKKGVHLYTLIMPYEKLYLAEAYHQKYYMQLVDVLKKDMKECYPNFRELIDSTAAARINGYLKGLGSMEQLMTEIEALGLSDKGKKRLIEIVDSY